MNDLPEMNDLPDERDAASPPADPTRPVLSGMSPAWQFVYDRLREGHAMAVLGQQDAPGSAEAAAILRASTEAVRAFRRVYQETSTRAIAGQIEGFSSDLWKD